MLGILSNSMIDEVLESNIVGRLGYSDGNKIYIIPISYLFYNRKYIIAHSREGQKIDILRKNPNLCLEVDEIDNLSNWKSVILWGKYEEITNPTDRYYALDLLIRKIMKWRLKETAISPKQIELNDSTILPDREKTIIYRIQIDNKSGRFEHIPASNHYGNPS
jgi:nitroimidazol reductase NimA-like FMN-containing flavoprotein (pyridoxamine 5'-phosphate oxidase superfamily)